MFDTIDSIVADALKTMGPDDLIFIKRHPHDRAVGMHIRNRYGLWDTSPLTEKWRTDESSRIIEDGIDYSKDHPDAVSDRILKRLVEVIDISEQQRRVELRAKVDEELKGAYW